MFVGQHAWFICMNLNESCLNVLYLSFSSWFCAAFSVTNAASMNIFVGGSALNSVQTLLDSSNYKRHLAFVLDMRILQLCMWHFRWKLLKVQEA
jgi:hypothetical protein